MHLPARFVELLLTPYLGIAPELISGFLVMLKQDLEFLETRTRGSQSSCSTGAGSAVDLKDMDRGRDSDAEYWPQQTEEAQHSLQRVGSHGSWHMHNERSPPTPDDGKQLAMRIVSMCCSSCSVPDFLEMQLRLMHCVAFCSLRHYNACWRLCELYCHTMHSRSIV